MFKNFIIASIRYYFRNYRFTILNIIGLSIGISVFIALTLFIQFELSFDNFHLNKDSIYRVEQLMVEGGRSELMKSCPTPLGPALKEEFPEIEYMSRVFITSSYYPFEIKTEDKSFVIETFYVDQDFLEMFTFPLIDASSKNLLSDPLQIVLTEKSAKQLFGNENPIGKTLENNDNLYTVSGILKDIPKNSHIQFDALCSMSTFQKLYGDDVYSWWDNWLSVYIKLKDNSEINSLSEKMKLILKKFWKEDTENQILLRPMKEIHLHSEISSDYAITGSIKNIYIIAVIAIIILIMAGVNYTNLATAQSANRLKEASLRKIHGASRKHLIKQLTIESILIVTISLIIAFFIFESLLPWFSNLVKRDLQFQYISNYKLSLFIAAISLTLGLLSSIYPSYIISNYNPLKMLKGSSKSSYKKPFLRKILVSIQYVMSISLIIITLNVLRQVNFMKNKDLGYNPQDIIRIEFADSSMGRINYLIDEISKNPDILGTSIHDYPICNSTNWTRISWEGNESNESMRMSVNYIDHHFVELYEMKLVEGKGFTAAQKGDSPEGNEVILNETAVKKMGLKNPIGKKIGYGGDYRGGIKGREATIVGVIKDFHFLSVHNTINPIMLRKYNEYQTGQSISVKISKNNAENCLKLLNTSFSKIFPEQVFKYHFVKDFHNKMYQEDQKLGYIILYLAILAIFIACIGVFGLVSFTTAQRTKEISIRKVLGSPIKDINWIFLKEFIIIISISFIISAPITFFWTVKWLQSYPYKVPFSIWPYLLTLILTLFITVITILLKTIKAANTNPVNNLRYE